MTEAAASSTGLLPKLERFSTYATHWLLDLVFPQRCFYCGKLDRQVCEGCRSLLDELPLKVAAQRVVSLDGVRATGKQAGILETAIKAFKYHDVVELRMPLAARLAACLDQQKWEIDAIVPVPLHADRESDRGYNQAKLLSEQLARLSGIRHAPSWLRRIRKTNQQASLAGAERLQNVAGAFESSCEVAGSALLLVDDVVTTGATLSAAADALRRDGAKAVYAMTVSHA